MIDSDFLSQLERIVGTDQGDFNVRIQSQVPRITSNRPSPESPIRSRLEAKNYVPIVFAVTNELIFMVRMIGGFVDGSGRRIIHDRTMLRKVRIHTNAKYVYLESSHNNYG